MQDDIKRFKFYYEQTNDSIYLDYIRFIETKDINVLRNMTDEQVLNFFRLESNYDYFEDAVMEFRYILLSNVHNWYLTCFILERSSEQDFLNPEFISSFNSAPEVELSLCLCNKNNISMFIVYKILDKIDEISPNVYKLYRDIILNSEIYFNKLIKYLNVYSSNILFAISGLTDSDLIEIYKKEPSLFLSLSLNDKVKLVGHIKTEECKKYFFDEFKLDSNIDFIDSSLYKYVDQDILLDYSLKNKKLLLEYFDYEHQYKYLKESYEFLNKNYNWLSGVNWSAVEQLLKEGIKFNIRLLFRSDNEYVLNYVKTQIIDLPKIYDLVDYRSLFQSNFFDNFSDEELDLIKKKIVIPCDENQLCMLYSIIEKVQNEKIFEALLKNSFDYIFNNGLNVKVSVSLDFIKKYVPGSLEKTFIENLGHKFLLIEDALNDKEKYEVLMDYLMKYPDIFQEYDGYSFKVTSCNLDYLNSLFPYLCKEYRKEFYELHGQSNVVLAYMKSDILSDFSLISNYELLEVFDFDEQKEILNGMSYNQLVSIIFSDSFKQHSVYTDVLFERKEEAIDYLNSGIFNEDDILIRFAFSTIFQKIMYSYDNNIDSFIDKIGCRTLLSFSEYFRKELDGDKFFDVLGNLLKNIGNFNFISSKFLSSLNDSDFDKYLKSSSFPSLLYSLFQLNSDKLKNALFEKIKTDNVLLYDPYVYTNLDKFLLFLSDDEKNFIEKIVENNLINSKYYYLFKDKIDNASMGAKASFTITNKFLDDSKIKIINKLYKKDKYLFDNLDYRLFTDEIYCLGDQLIILLNRYPVLVDTVCKIMDSACKNIFINLNKYLIENNYPDDIYSEHMWCLLYYFKNYGYDLGSINNYDNNSLLGYLEERMYLLLKNTINKDLKRPLIQEEYINANYDINYYSRKYKMLDDLFKSSTDIEKMQDLFFAKYFGLHGSIIRSFIYSYGTNYEDIQNIVDTNIPYKYISLINKVLSISDIDLMKELYAKNSIFYDTSDYIQITKTLDRAYNKVVVGDATNDCMVENHTFSVNGRDINTNVTILGEEGIFVHSTDAYGSLKLIDNDYFYSWQYNSNTANNGICTCYITNSNQGSAPVKGAGVLFGFRNVSEESIAVYAPYDIISVNTGIKILNLRDELKMRLDKIPSFTRHTHNEFVLYRRDKKTDSDYPCLMPTSIVIYEDMSDSIKENSFKAIEDFKKHGIELEVVYRDRKKIVSDEMNKIEIYIQEYYKTNDLTLLANIIDKYETNICGCDFIDIDKDILFKTDMVKQVLIDTLCDIENNNEMERFEEFIDILEKENYKFKIIEENLANRAHTFVLYDSIKGKIENVRKTLYGGDVYGFRK